MPVTREENSSPPTGLTGLEVAVIGMAGRFPGARHIDEFWNNLKNGIESITFFTHRELEEAGISTELLNNPNYVKANSLLEDKEYFDPSFFGYSSREAEVMDPQLRLFHEYSWQALEDAGYDSFTYTGSIGVYAGAAHSLKWQALTMLSGKSAQLGEFAAALMNNSSLLSTWISHKLDLRGPSFTLFTACSTSLVTIHLAYRALITGECSMALAGGVTVVPTQKEGHLYQEEMIFSPDGHCRAFDARAKGTILGEGIGIVVMKRAKEALADRDHIYALVKGTAINNDGMTKVNYTAPSVQGEFNVIRKALKLAKVNPEDITYVEAHGTGTKLGDPIEISALTKSFNTNKRNYCALASVKTNVGHLDIAAGICSFIKTVLVLKHRFIPPSLNFETPNPNIDFENSPFYVNTEAKKWDNQPFPLRAAVSAFGIGGTNAHVILEEAPGTEDKRQTTGNREQGERRGGLSPTDQSREYQLIVLSAKTPSALDKMTENLTEYLKENFLNPGNHVNPMNRGHLLNPYHHENPAHPGANLADIAYTLQTGRKAFRYRRMFVCSEVEKAIEILSSRDLLKLRSAQAKNADLEVVFMFPGQGAQYVNMGLDLYKSETVFRNEIDRCFGILKPIIGYDLKEILYPGDFSPLEGGVPERRGVSNPAASQLPLPDDINQTEIAQPLLFSFEYALAQLLIKWGIEPGVMMGHSIGEYVAACISGVFSLEDALKLVALRGRAMQQLPGGAMVSAAVSEEELAPLLEQHPDISLAAVNAPRLCVISGPHEAIAAIIPRLEEKGYKTRRLHTSHAFHSGMMEPILNQFAHQVSQVKLNKPAITIMSNITGKPLAHEQAADPGYWAAHLRSCVRFSAAAAGLLPAKDRVFLEIGPGKTLSTFINQHKNKQPGPSAVNLVRHPQENISDVYYLLDKIGQLWLYGKKINWTDFYTGQERYRVSLPPYPFTRQRYWLDMDLAPLSALQSGQLGQLEQLGQVTPAEELSRKADMADWFYIPYWEQYPFTVDDYRDTAGQCRWLIFVDEHGIGSRLAMRLTRQNQRVCQVKAGPRFCKDGEDQYVIRPCCGEDYHALFKELHSIGNIPQKIVHCWSVIESNHNEKEPNLERYTHLQDPGFFSLLNIGQALGKESITDEIQLAVVTNNMHEITGEDQLYPEKATIIGAVKVIPLEYPNINCRSIDIPLPPSYGDKGRQNPQESKEEELLLQELRLDFPMEDIVVALRGNYRWIRRWKPVRFDKPREPLRHLRKRGVYLITGGMGGIGFTLARHLARTREARLILTRRSPYPPREEWHHWATSTSPGKNRDLGLQIREILELEAQGAEFMIVNADVTNREQMQAVLHQGKKRFGQINGVIHAAGEIDYGGVIQRRTREITENSMAAKVKGTLVLEELLKQEPLDFFLLCSTVGNILYREKFGQVGYAAANEFLEAFASYKANVDRSGTYTIALNWPDWLEVGMVMQALHKKHNGSKEDIEADIRTFADFAVSPAEGVEIFDRIMSRSYSRVSVSPQDLDIMSRQMNRWLKRHKQGKTELPGTGVKPGLSQSLYQRPDLTTPYAAPTNDIQQKLAAIFQELFALQQVGIYDDFFELGGNSLTAMSALTLIHKELDVKIPLAELFNNPTIKALAQCIMKSEKSRYFSLQPAEEKEFYPLSPAQERLYFIQQVDARGTAYNLFSSLVMEGYLDSQRLEEIFKKLIARHESLRTSFLLLRKQPVQQIHREVNFKITCFEPGKEEREKIIKNFTRVFDLGRGPLLRVGLMKLGREQHILMVDIHHIVSDEVSTGILIDDFTALYQGEELPVLKFRYRDFSEWQDKLHESEEIKKQEEYWLTIFKDEPPSFELPIDFSRRSMTNFEGDAINFEPGKEIGRKVSELAGETDTTLFMVLFSVYFILMAKYSGLEDIVIGTKIAGRANPEIQQTIGMFVNMLPIRNQPQANKRFKEFLNEVKLSTLKAFENQDYPFQKLVKKLGFVRQQGRNPLFDAVFDFSHMESGARAVDNMKITPCQSQTGLTNFDLHLKCEVVNGIIRMELAYSTKLFKPATVQKIKHRYLEILNQVANNREIKLKDITISHDLVQSTSMILQDMEGDFVF